MKLKKRAESYAKSCKGQYPEASKFGYIAGAKEEHILLIERAMDWLAYAVCEDIISTDNLPRAITSLKEALDNEQD